MAEAGRAVGSGTDRAAGEGGEGQEDQQDGGGGDAVAGRGLGTEAVHDDFGLAVVGLHNSEAERVGSGGKSGRTPPCVAARRCHLSFVSGGSTRNCRRGGAIWQPAKVVRPSLFPCGGIRLEQRQAGTPGGVGIDCHTLEIPVWDQGPGPGPSRPGIGANPGLWGVKRVRNASGIRQRSWS
jgi:hypothetical protein